jgi:hypothetical protein
VKSLNQLGREELYDLVWTEALALLAPKLGISDVGLKKRCESLGIPTPGRGYWARLAAGKGVKREPLPSSWSIQRKSKSLPKSVEAVRHFNSNCEYAEDGLAKPALNALHRLKKSKPSSDGLVSLGGAGFLSINVAPDNLGRAAWLWSRLMDELPKHGLSQKQGPAAPVPGAGGRWNANFRSNTGPSRTASPVGAVQASLL